MRKIICLCLLSALLVPAAFAGGTDFSSMSDAEIIDSIRGALAEMADREADDGLVVYDNRELGIRVSITGIRYADNGTVNDNLLVLGILLNASEYAVTARLDHVYVNVWPCGEHPNVFLSAEPGRNDRGTMASFLYIETDAGVSTGEEIRLIEGDVIITFGDEEAAVSFVYVCRE